jgi:hypothetical protein
LKKAISLPKRKRKRVMKLKKVDNQLQKEGRLKGNNLKKNRNRKMVLMNSNNP